MGLLKPKCNFESNSQMSQAAVTHSFKRGGRRPRLGLAGHRAHVSSGAFTWVASSG